MNSQLRNQEKDKEGFENNQGLVSIYPIAHAVVGMFALYNRKKHRNKSFCWVGLGYAVLYASPANTKRSTSCAIAVSIQKLSAFSKSSKRE